jgi:hypothetical protein
MSPKPIDRSPDLRHLRDDGFDISIRTGYLVMRDVPYVAPGGRPARGVLVDFLDLNGEIANPPRDHTMLWAGATPCDRAGQPIGLFDNSESQLQIDSEFATSHRFSAKPKTTDPDYYTKFIRYLRHISAHAQALDATMTAATFPVVQTDDEDSVFLYTDTASSRANVTALNHKLRVDRIAIVGLGGTGSYILDAIAKAEVREIHLFDGDVLHQHNAFRSPGAASLEDLQLKPFKVMFHQERYSRLRRGIVAHPIHITAANLDELNGMNFVFLALDGGPAKRDLVTRLEELGLPFIDVGMDIYEADGALDGVLRVTTSTPTQRDHVWANHRIPFSDGDPQDEYRENIQIVELNALNAALAVIKWKKLVGFYHDAEHEHNSKYTLDGNHLLNEDCP